MPNRRKPLIIAIAGGTGSGKTTVSQRILKHFADDNIAYLPHDAYYRDLRDMPMAEKDKVNFDHPNSLESELLVEHIRALRNWQSIELPIYDFTTHSRLKEKKTIHPSHVVIVEGILIFAEKQLRDEFDVKIFVDTDNDLRFIRRLQRDINDRGRSTESVIRQYLTTVRPMHIEFVEPSKRFADVIIPVGGFNTVALDMVISRIDHLLRIDDHLIT
ncbi:MAG TPA: uridine kinase [Bellilinea sp.]|nr:uridine kinase [Bellilinea sp.]